MADLRRIFRHSFRMYFAPIVGALKGIHAEYRLIERERREAMPVLCAAVLHDTIEDTETTL